MITGRKIIFELFSGALQENPVIALGAITSKILRNYFWSAVIAPFAPVKISGEIFWSSSPPQPLWSRGWAGAGSGVVGVPWCRPGAGLWET